MCVCASVFVYVCALNRAATCNLKQQPRRQQQQQLNKINQKCHKMFAQSFWRFGFCYQCQPLPLSPLATRCHSAASLFALSLLPNWYTCPSAPSSIHPLPEIRIAPLLHVLLLIYVHFARFYTRHLFSTLPPSLSPSSTLLMLLCCPISLWCLSGGFSFPSLFFFSSACCSFCFAFLFTLSFRSCSSSYSSLYPG